MLEPQTDQDQGARGRYDVSIYVFGMVWYGLVTFGFGKYRVCQNSLVVYAYVSIGHSSNHIGTEPFPVPSHFGQIIRWSMVRQAYMSEVMT